MGRRIELAILYILCFIFTFGHSVEQDCFMRRIKIENKSSAEGLLQEAAVKSRIDCVTLCNGKGNCNVMFYNPQSNLCRLYSLTSNNFKTQDHPEWECWEAPSIDCGKPDHFIRRNYSVCYNRTTYGSTARVQCGLGKYSARDGQSVCGANGRWTPVHLQCEDIPNMRGTKTLETFGTSNLECRNVMSDFVGENGMIASYCKGNEVLTGCSARTSETDKVQQTKGSFVSSLMCLTKRDRSYFSSVESVARCCKIPGIQCEYIRSKTDSGPVGCFKNFQLIDCSCWRQRSPAGPCPTLPTNSTCQGHPSIRAWRYATCCTHENLRCYMKTARGQSSIGSDYLTIQCGSGETMTACSGYNVDRGIKEAIVRVTGGADECRIDRGRGRIETLTGYVSCCKMEHA